MAPTRCCRPQHDLRWTNPTDRMIEACLLQDENLWERKICICLKSSWCFTVLSPSQIVIFVSYKGMNFSRSRFRTYISHYHPCLVLVWWSHCVRKPSGLPDLYRAQTHNFQGKLQPCDVIAFYWSLKRTSPVTRISRVSLKDLVCWILEPLVSYIKYDISHSFWCTRPIQIKCSMSLTLNRIIYFKKNGTVII